MAFVPGENIGSYRIIEQLGQGGMATVFKAYHAALDRYVAIKVLHPAFLEDENFLARFQREARLVAKLEHPNIVPVYDFSQHQGQPYLVMKYIEGETLKARMSRGPLSSAEVLEIITAVGAGLSYAHRQGILHRDIKPSNVILAQDGGVYLADFGLARIAQGGGSTLTSDMIIGTPQYIAPEQALGKKDLDERTDIYSLGVMLYEIAVGRVPFSADTPFAIIHDHIYSPLPLPRELNPNVPLELERVLLKALAKEREDRYETVDDLITAFKQAWVEAGLDKAAATLKLPMGAVETPPAEPAATPAPVSQTAPAAAAAETRTPPTKKSRPWGWVAAGVLLVMACFFLVTTIFALRRHPAAEVVPTVPGEVLMSPMMDEPPANGDPQALFERGVSLWDEERYALAQQTFRQLLKQCGDDVDCLMTFGDKAYEAGAWTGAALFYARGAGLLAPDVPDDVKDRLADTVFESAVYPDTMQPDDFRKLHNIAPELALLGEARYYFYAGDESKAYDLLKQLYDSPQPVFAVLLDLDFAVADQHWDEARSFLAQLEDARPLPEWIEAYLGYYQEQIPAQ